MHDAVGVEIAQGAKGILEDEGALTLGELLGKEDQVRNSHSVDELHDKVDLFVRFVVEHTVVSRARDELNL